MTNAFRNYAVFTNLDGIFVINIFIMEENECLLQLINIPPSLATGEITPLVSTRN